MAALLTTGTQRHEALASPAAQMAQPSKPARRADEWCHPTHSSADDRAPLRTLRARRTLGPTNRNRLVSHRRLLRRGLTVIGRSDSNPNRRIGLDVLIEIAEPFVGLLQDVGWCAVSADGCSFGSSHVPSVVVELWPGAVAVVDGDVSVGPAGSVVSGSVVDGSVVGGAVVDDGIVVASGGSNEGSGTPSRRHGTSQSGETAPV